MTAVQLFCAFLFAATMPVVAGDPAADTLLYRAQIAAASAYLRLDEAGVARTWLAATPSGSRGWEWSYLTGESDASAWQLVGHEGPVQALAFSPDGKSIASAGRDRTVRLWDVTTRTEVRTLRGHEGEVLALAFSPDGRHLATASRDTTLRIWDTASGATRNTLNGHSQAIGAVAWSRDGQTLASGSYQRSAKGSERPTDGIIRLWNATTGVLIREIVSDGYAPVVALHFHRESKRLLAGSWDQTVKVYDLAAEGAPRVAKLEPESGYRAVNAVAWSPDGARFASGGKDRLVRLWDGTRVAQVTQMSGHRGWVQALAYSPDGNQIASASIDTTIKIWRTESGQIESTLRGHAGAVLAIAWSPDGRTLASGSDDGTIRAWDSVASARGAFHKPHESASIYALRFSLDGKHLLLGLSNGEVRIEDALSGRRIRTLVHPEWVGSLRWRRDGRELLVACGDGRVHRWDSESWTEVQALAGHETAVAEADYVGAGDATIVSTSRDNTLKIWDLANATAKHTLRGHEKNAETLAVQPSGRLIASGGRDGTLRLWDAASGEPTGVLAGHDGPIQRVAWRPDGSLVASAGSDATVRLWDPVGGRVTTVLRGHTATVTGLAWSPDGKRLASGGSDDTVRIWDPQDGHELVALHGFEGGVWSLTWSPDGERLAAACLGAGYRILEASMVRGTSPIRP